jgi:hypothetical protein
MAMKQRRVTKMMADLKRWRREGNRPATVEKTEVEVAEHTLYVSNEAPERSIVLLHACAHNPTFAQLLGVVENVVR